MKALSGRVRFTAARCLLLATLFAFAGPRLEATPAKLLDIADTVSANPILTKLSALLQSSEMTTFLSSRGPFTFFAPTDAAFDRLPPGTLDALLRPENKERLQDIVLFHVVNGKKWMAKDLLTATALLSCEGNPLTIKKTKTGTQLVLKAKIVHADIRCLNGVIHEIDTVLMPPESALPPIAPPRPPPPPTPPPSAPAPTPTQTAPSQPPAQVLPTDVSGGTNATVIPVAPPAPSPPTPTPTQVLPTDVSGGTNATMIPVAPMAPTEAPEVSPH